MSSCPTAERPSAKLPHRAQGRALTLQVRGQQREGVLGEGGLGVGQREQQQQPGHEAGGAGHPVGGSSGPRGCPLAHMQALEGDAEESWGRGRIPSTPAAGGLLPGLSPEDPVELGKEPSRWHCLRPDRLSLSLKALPTATGPSWLARGLPA